MQEHLMDEDLARDSWSDAVLINEITDRIGQLASHREYLVAEIAEIDAHMKRYRAALKALEPRALTPPRETPHSPKGRAKKNKERNHRAMLNSSVWPEIRAAIIAYAHEHDEFTQSEFRAEAYQMTSGKSSIAFAILHDEKVLRISRVQGNNKYYRLMEGTDAA